MLNVALANIKTYARRYIAVILAVAIGTAFLAATLAVNTSTTATLRNSLGDAYKNADLVAFQDSSLSTGSQEPTQLTLDQVRGLRELPEVASAAADAYAGVELHTADNGYQALVKPVAAGKDGSGLELNAGQLPKNGHELAMDADSAHKLGLSIGDSVALGDGKDASTAAITGLFDASRNPRLGGMVQTVMPEQAWEAAYGQQAAVDSIIIKDNGSVSASAAQQAVKHYFAGQKKTDINVLSGDEKVLAEIDAMSGGDGQLTLVLLVFALVALIVTGLVVVNTFSVVIAQRTRELALLRVLGAKRRQIRSSVLIEALLIGIAASVLGVLLAVGLLYGLIAILHAAVPSMSYATVAMNAMGIVVPLLVGIIMTVVAASLPARRAMKLAPLAALRPFESATAKTRAGKARIIIGFLLALAGAALLVFGALAGQLLIAFAGGLLSFPGVLMIASLFVPASVFSVGRLLAGKSTAGKLAALNAVRNPGRTTATATALLIGVTLVSMIMVGGQTAKATLNAGVDGEYPVDLMVSLDGSKDGSVDPQLVERLEKLDGVVSGMAFERRFAEVETDDGGFNLPLMIVDPQQFADVAWSADIVPEAGQIVFSSWDAKDPVQNVGGAKLKVKKTSSELMGYNIITAQDAKSVKFEANDLVERGVALKLDPQLSGSAVSELVQQVADAAGVDSYMVDGGVVAKSMFSQVIDVLLAIVSALLAVAVLIALIGVANTLSLSVLERTRENSLLRALGLKKKQLRSMLAIEAVLIGGVAAVLGLVLGTAYGLLGARSALSSMGELVYALPWWQLAAVLAVSILAALLASVTPGRRAAKLSPVEGLAAE